MTQTTNFLSLFKGSKIFATIGDKEKTSFYHYAASFEEALPYLKRDNELGRGVFFAVNELDQNLDPKRKRTKKMFVASRAVWVEDDTVRDAPRNDWPVAPNAVVNSSPGKYHYYWLTITSNREEYEQVMNRMVQDHGCDIQARDITRVLRVPGFNHMKREPYEVTCKINRKKPYLWKAIKVAFPPLEDIAKEHVSQAQGGTQAGDSIAELIDSAQQGHAHGPSVQMALSLANRGLPESDILAIVSLLPEYNEGDHLHSVRTAIAKVQAEQQESDEESDMSDRIDSIKDEQRSVDTDMSYPPGLFGQLCKETFEMAHHPYRAVSLATCVGLVAGIVGRRYNVSDLGLNIYITLLMETGMGKDFIRKCINRTLMEIDPLNGSKFVGAARFTGVPALWKMMLDGMNRVSVITEAGFLNGSEVGDRKGLTATMLSFYTASGRRDKQNSNEYSNKDSSLPMLHAPALSLIQESTPKSFIEALIKSDGDINGDLARMWLIRVNDRKPHLNWKPRQEYSKKIKDRIKSLMKEALTCGGNEDPSKNVTVLDRPDWLKKYNDDFVDREMEAKEKGQTYERVMLSRAWVKSVKIAAIIDVFNDEETITKKTYDWVIKEVISRELENIDRNIRMEDSSDLDNVVKNVVGRGIVSLLKKPKSGIKKSLAKKGVFLKRDLTQNCKNNPAVKDYANKRDGFTANDGVSKIIEFMTREGLLLKLNKQEIMSLEPTSRATVGYRITDDFIAMYDLSLSR
jgi:hypothetical protein